MEVISLISESLFLDYLIVTTQNFTYDNNHIQVNYNSHLDIADVDAKLLELQTRKDELSQDPLQGGGFVETLDRAIQILTDLREKLN